MFSKLAQRQMCKQGHILSLIEWSVALLTVIGIFQFLFRQYKIRDGVEKF